MKVHLGFTFGSVSIAIGVLQLATDPYTRSLEQSLSMQFTASTATSFFVALTILSRISQNKQLFYTNNPQSSRLTPI